MYDPLDTRLMTLCAAFLVCGAVSAGCAGSASPSEATGSAARESGSPADETDVSRDASADRETRPSGDAESGHEPAPGPATEPPTPPPAPACEPQLRGDRVVVDGVDTGVEPSDRDRNPRRLRERGLELVTWPVDDATVAVALANPSIRNEVVEVDGQLWRVPCDDPAASTLWIDEIFADFGHAALSADGRHLFYTSYTDGVGVVELATGERRRLLRPMPIDDCTLGPSPSADLVVGILDDGRTLRVERATHCGEPPTWTGRVYDVRVWPVPEAALPYDDPRILQARRVASLVADADGTLWLGDGAGCEDGAAFETLEGGVWRSPDHGESWSPVTFDTSGELGGVVQVLADAREPGAVLVVTAPCAEDDGDPPSNAVFYTRSDGARWTRLPLDGLPTHARHQTPLIERIALRDGDLSHLLVQTSSGVAKTNNAGRDWEPYDGAFPAAGDAFPLEHSGFRFEATERGLERTELSGDESKHVFPSVAAELAVGRNALREALDERSHSPVAPDEHGPAVTVEVQCTECPADLVPVQRTFTERGDMDEAYDRSSVAHLQLVSPFERASMPASMHCDGRCCRADGLEPAPGDDPQLLVRSYCVAPTAVGPRLRALRFEEPATSDAERDPVASSEPACKPVLKKGRIYLDDTDTGIRVTDRYDDDLSELDAADRELVTWPLNAATVAVALADRRYRSSSSPPSDGRLWRIPCDDPAESELWVDEPAADFGMAALGPDGSRLLYSNTRHGIGILDLRGGLRRRLLEPPMDDDCSGFRKITSTLVKERIDDDTLRIEVGQFCGFDWRGQLFDVDIDPLPTSPLMPRDPRIRPTRIVASFAVGADGTLWVGDSGHHGSGTTSEHLEDGLWRSTDEGASWSSVRIEGAEHGVAVVRAHSTDPDALIVVTGMSYNGRSGHWGGRVFRTEDGGETWTALEGIPDAKYEDPLVEALALPNGDLETIVIRQLGGTTGAIHRSTDGGESWAETSTLPAQSPTGVERDGKRYELEDGELWRTDIETGASAIVFPEQTEPTGG